MGRRSGARCRGRMASRQRVGVLRVEPADFEVDEELGFAPSGTGEHAFLLIEKCGANTEWVARRLAEAAGVAPMAVGYAGLKDRHAITRQSFSVQLPGRADPDWAALAIPGVRVISASSARSQAQTRRASRQSISGSACAMCSARAMKSSSVWPSSASAACRTISASSASVATPAISSARAAVFAGRRMPRAERSLAISAARSLVFNAVLAQTRRRSAAGIAASKAKSGCSPARIRFSGRNRGRPNSRSVSPTFDIDPTGPLIGAGELRSTDAGARDRAAAIEAHRDLAEGLAKAGLAQQRRALRLPRAGLAARMGGRRLARRRIPAARGLLCDRRVAGTVRGRCVGGLNGRNGAESAMDGVFSGAGRVYSRPGGAAIVAWRRVRKMRRAR